MTLIIELNPCRYDDNIIIAFNIIDSFSFAFEPRYNSALLKPKLYGASSAEWNRYCGVIQIPGSLMDCQCKIVLLLVSHTCVGDLSLGYQLNGNPILARN